MRRRQIFSQIRKSIPVFAASVLIVFALTACGKSADNMERVTTLYESGPEFEAQLSVTAELSDNRQEYVLQWQHMDGSDFMTVLQPELIAGISARMEPEGDALVYGDMVLEIEPSGTRLSPLEAVPEICRDWGSQCVDRASELLDGENVLAVTYEHEKHGLKLRQRVWFDCASLKPLKAELYTEDRLTASFEFQLFDFR